MDTEIRHDTEAAITDYLEAVLPWTTDEADRRARTAEYMRRRDVGDHLAAILEPLAGDHGVCAKANDGNGLPILVALREGWLWLVSHEPGDSEVLGRVGVRRFTRLRDAQFRKVFEIESYGDQSLVTIELEQDRLPGGRLVFAVPRRKSVAAELVEALEVIVSGE